MPNQRQRLITVQSAVNQIKILIEKAIRKDGAKGKTSVITSQVPINLLHDAIKAEFINKGVNSNYIHPAYKSKGEITLHGYLKTKKQDIVIFPNNLNKAEEKIIVDGLLKDSIDKHGKDLTEATLTVNVRSQLSSVAKNFDTLFERTFAEPLNFHLRCPNMVLGEFYMINVYEYDDDAIKKKRVAFKGRRSVEKHLKKYITSFQSLNNRQTTGRQDYKYERVCLLIVDFNNATPIIYNTTNELKSAGLISQNSTLNIDNMNFPTFVSSLLSTYETRFGANRFT